MLTFGKLAIGDLYRYWPQGAFVYRKVDNSRCVLAGSADRRAEYEVKSNVLPKDRDRQRVFSGPAYGRSCRRYSG
jgi:hypothetical protein